MKTFSMYGYYFLLKFMNKLEGRALCTQGLLKAPPDASQSVLPWAINCPRFSLEKQYKSIEKKHQIVRFRCRHHFGVLSVNI